MRNWSRIISAAEIISELLSNMLENENVREIISRKFPHTEIYCRWMLTKVEIIMKLFYFTCNDDIRSPRMVGMPSIFL